MQHLNGVTTLHPWGKGMNNRAQVRALPDETVRNVVNADFHSSGDITSRKKPVKVYSGLALSTGFSCPLGAFIIENTVLKSFDGTTATVLYNGVVGTTPSFCAVDDTVYFTDGLINLKIVNGAASKWGMDVPAAPILSTTSGSLGAGVYQAALVWVDDNGVESGASSVRSILAPDNSGIVFGNLPYSEHAWLRLYLSSANGDVLYRVTDKVPGAVSSYAVTTETHGALTDCQSLFVSPPPAGRLVRFYKGRIYVADNVGDVWISEPFGFDRFMRAKGYERFEDLVDIMEPVDDGIFFAAGEVTWFYRGTPEDGFGIERKFDYGGIYGTGYGVPNAQDGSFAMWQSQRGAILAKSGGQCINLQEKNVATETGTSGAGIVREYDGGRHFVAAIKQPTPSTLAAKDFITAEIIRRGTT